jgi:hypothetical protein
MSCLADIAGPVAIALSEEDFLVCAGSVKFFHVLLKSGLLHECSEGLLGKDALQFGPIAAATEGFSCQVPVQIKGIAISNLMYGSLFGIA